MSYLQIKRALPGLVLIFLLLSTTVIAANDREASIREQRRQTIPVDKLVLMLESPEREKEMQRQPVIEAFGVRKGEAVADIGAGTGFFSFPLAAMVGTEGKVYAVEIEDELLKYIGDKMEATGITNIIPVKSSATGPNLPAVSCDKILLINTYNYLADPVTFMRNTRLALKPSGLVAVISLDPTKTIGKVRKRLLISGKRASAGEVIARMKQAGFAFRKSYDFLDSRFFLVFSPVK